MIDVLLVILLVTALALRLGRSVPALRLAALFAAAGALAHTACTALLFARSPAYEYVIAPSPASRAGLFGGGTVAAVDGAPADSLGQVLGAVLGRNHLELRAARPFRRETPRERGAFWGALDSYDLEEAAGGLAFLPRRPVYKGYLPKLYQQVSAPEGAPLRIISAHGEATPTIGRFLAPMDSVPAGGLLSLRYMNPGPDNGVSTFYYAPLAFEPPESVGGRRPSEIAQTHFGLSGLPVLAATPGGLRARVIRAVGGEAVDGPAAFAEMLRRNPAIPATMPDADELIAWPRLALLPELYESGWATWLAGLPAPYLRQLLRLPRLLTLARISPMVPKQYYLLDDAYGAPSVFFKLSSLGASLALALLAWAGVGRALPAIARRRTPFVLALVLLLQLADLFVIRIF